MSRSSEVLIRRVAILLVLQLLQTRSICAQVRIPSVTPSLYEFFRSLVEHYDPAKLPSSEGLLKVQEEVAGLSPEDISKGLPMVIAAFAHRDDTVKKYAAGAIFSIEQRSDGADLLRPYAKAISDGLAASDSGVQGITVLLLPAFGPTVFSPDAHPPGEVVAALVKFVNRTDRNPNAQADALSFLLKVAPENPAVIPAFQSFSSRSLNSETKAALINGVANSHTENLVATDMLTQELADPDERVRFQAAQAFQRMPKQARRRAQPALQKLIDRPEESGEVKAAAQEALRQSW